MKKLSWLLILLSLISASCSNEPTDKPFPAKGSEFEIPSTQKISFAPEKKFEWILVNMDTLPKLAPSRFSFAGLPSRQLTSADFTPLKKAPIEIKFDPDTLRRSKFTIDTVAARKFSFRVSVLGEPKRVKATPPRLKDGASQNLLLFGQDQGLPGTIVQSMLQDNQGMVWVGTDNGLCRYDGEFCNIYSIEQGLSGNWSYRLMTDNSGRIWVGTNISGIDILDIGSGIIKHLGTEQGLLSNNILALLQDSEGLVWISTARGLQLLDEKAGTLKTVGANAGLNTTSNLITGLFEDAEKRVWINLFQKGIDIIDKKKKEIVHLTNKTIVADNSFNRKIEQDKYGRVYTAINKRAITIIDLTKGIIRNIGKEEGLGDYDISCIKKDASGNIWVGSNGGGVTIFDATGNQMKNFNVSHGLSNNNVFSLLADDQGQVWVGTNGGELNIYPNTGFILQHYTGSQGLTNKSSFVYALTEERDGSLWVGSLGGGLNIIDEKSGTIRYIDTTLGLSDNNVRSLLADDSGSVWAGTAKGLNIINKRSGVILHILNNSAIRVMRQAGKDSILIGTSAGLIVMNKNSPVIKVANNKNGLSSNAVSSIATDRKGRIWIGTYKGINVLDPVKNTLTHINSDKILENDQVLAMLCDASGNIWAGTSGGGVYRIDEAGTATKFTVNQGLANNFVLSLLEKNGIIYAGTGKGLTAIHPVPADSKKTNSWNLVSYGKAQGLLRVDFNPSALLTSTGRMWWTEADVLTSMDEVKTNAPASSPAVFITGIDIMEQSYPFISNKERRKIFTSADTLWSTEKNASFTKNDLPPDSGYYATHNIEWDSLDKATGIPVNLSLPYDQDHLTIHFTGTHLSNTDKTGYRYFLQGNDKDWGPVTSKAFADYRNLAPGNYSFQVRSRGFNGKWSEASVFNFTIRSPWWQTWWMYIIYAIVIGTILRAYIVYRSAKLRRQNKVLEEKVVHRTTQLQQSINDLKTTQSQLIQSEKMASLGELTAGIAHEIQNPLNFVNNFSEVNMELVDEMKSELATDNTQSAIDIADDIKQNLEKIAHHGKRADAIVKGMLQHSRASSGKKEPTDINALADEYLRLSYHGLRAKDKSFNANFKTDPDETIGKINVMPQDMGRVLLNLFTNAFYSVAEKKKLHPDSYEPTVSVTTKKDNGNVIIKVRDNGVGIPQKVLDKIYQPFFTTKPTGQGTGLGLSMSYDIIKAHGGEIKAETKEGEFAEFVLILPIN